MHSQPRCRRCGDPISFDRMPGFVPAGQRPKYIPVNLDDGKAHFRRCKINQDLAAAKRAASVSVDSTSAKVAQSGEPKARQKRLTTQGDLLDALKTR